MDIRKISSKKGAIELSISTIVIIVLAMSMLILGLVLIKGIFSVATSSVDITDDKIKGQLTQLFQDDNKDVVVKAGADRTIKVKPNTGQFSVGIGARTPDGSSTDRTRLQYKITLEEPTGSNCASKLGGLKAVEGLFTTPINSFRNFDEFQGANSFAAVQLDVPEGTATCSQKVFIDVIDKQASPDNNKVGGSFFIVEILKEGFF